MPVYLTNATRNAGLDGKRLKRTVETLLAAVGEKGSSVSLTLVRDPAIRAINREHRGKDAPTDVLSFPLLDDPREASPEGTERLLGDIVVSVDTAARQAADYDATVAAEVDRLLIHGVLHLMGHDHMEPEERARMEAEERRLADTIGMPWPYL
jgi:probable rRNA maturation factor